MSHKSNFSLSLINFVIDFFFRVALPPYDSRDVLKKKLESPAKTICLSYKSLIASSISSRSWLVATCPLSVLGLCILTRTELDSPTLTFNIEIRPFSSIFLSKTSTLLLPIYPIATPQDLFYRMKKIGLFNSSAHFFSPAKDEWVTCKRKNPLQPNLFFKYSNILILLREFYSPLTLLDIKCIFTPIRY